jgi:hypothetical protein
MFAVLGFFKNHIFLLLHINPTLLHTLGAQIKILFFSSFQPTHLNRRNPKLYIASFDKISFHFPILHEHGERYK